MSYVPDVGDIIYLDFDPQLGHEEAKRRPALLLSPKAYNQKTHLLICVPLTTKIKNYPFEVAIKAKLNSVALSDQVKSLDWVARNAVFIQKASQDELKSVKEKVALLLGI
ncbi:toxin MazF [Helicobacter sp. CLO-3]|uniref:endoribonuclease MazF n=1 Tax=unclassified Helicobacter TaxID=2593540 RepID=UPI000805FFE6|nr:MULTISPECIES: endoribonuclease MazF [unclassified Helicobacter]OBV30135.1 toxin MazF [Helicobacter sp. CLO-3]OHU83521.1 toxin MazF [Helicobacter sp. CLO-3]